MHPAVERIMVDAGATAEDIAVLERLGITIRKETLDVIASATKRKATS